jgi:hypothetical protein
MISHIASLSGISLDVWLFAIRLGTFTTLRSWSEPLRVSLPLGGSLRIPPPPGAWSNGSYSVGTTLAASKCASNGARGNGASGAVRRHWFSEKGGKIPHVGDWHLLAELS